MLVKGATSDLKWGEFSYLVAIIKQTLWSVIYGCRAVRQHCWNQIRHQQPGGGGTPYEMGDTYVPRFWPPFFTLAGSSTIFLGYFSHPPTAKLSFGVQKLPIFTKIDLFGPKFNFFLDLFGSNFQRPAAHPHQFSGRVPPPPPGQQVAQQPWDNRPPFTNMV